MVPIPTATDEEVPDLANAASIASAVGNDYLCAFAVGPTSIDTTIVPDLYAGLLGGEWSTEKLLESGKETIKIERMFNEAAGFTAEDDRLPDFFREPGPEGTLPPFPLTDEVVQRGVNSIYSYEKQNC
jgi:aldehyde:ferredoxin oxidoreductase